MALYAPPPRPVQFEHAMVFMDGSNMFPNLNEAKLRVPSFLRLAEHIAMPRMLARAYIYTTRAKAERALEIHGANCFEGCRLVFGHVLEKIGGREEEKGVDTLLASDLVYHAAMKNIKHAVVVSNDSDFSWPLKRVEDFGCRTAVLSIVKRANEVLRTSCDDFTFWGSDDLVRMSLAVPRQD